MDDYGAVRISENKFFAMFRPKTVGKVSAALMVLADFGLVSKFSYKEEPPYINFYITVTPQGRAYFEARNERIKTERKEHRRLFLSSLVTGVIMLVLGFLLGKLDSIISWLGSVIK
jgi:hypothetical protein